MFIVESLLSTILLHLSHIKIILVWMHNVILNNLVVESFDFYVRGLRGHSLDSLPLLRASLNIPTRSSNIINTNEFTLTTINKMQSTQKFLTVYFGKKNIVIISASKIIKEDNQNYPI